MAKKDWVWMGRPAHFIAAQSCHFRLATYIPKSGVVVSTVGDYDPGVGIAGMKRPHDIGWNRKYETFVFRAREEKECDGCPWHAETAGGEIDSLPANTANQASRNHYELCEKWDKRTPPPKSGERGKYSR